MREILGGLDCEAAFKLGQWLQIGKVSLKPKNQKLWSFATQGMPASSGVTQSTKRSGNSLARRGLGYVGIFCHQPQVYQMGEGLVICHTWAASLIMNGDCTEHYSVIRSNTHNVMTDKYVQHLAIEHTVSAPPYSQSTAAAALTWFGMTVTAEQFAACGLAFVGHVILESRITQREEVSDKTIKEQRLLSSRQCWRQHQ